MKALIGFAIIYALAVIAEWREDRRTTRVVNANRERARLEANTRNPV